MASQARHWLVVETVSGRRFLTEARDGAVIWQELHGGCKQRRGRVVGSAVCAHRGLRLRDIHAQRRHPRYAQAAFALGAGLPDAESELAGASAAPPPEAGPSHDGGKRLSFDVRHLASRQPELIISPVEPVDSAFRRFGGRCLYLRNALSPEECAHFVEAMDADAKPVRYRQDYRRNDRCVVESPALADVLYRRVLPALEGLVVVAEAEGSRQHLMGEDPGLCPEELQLNYALEGAWHPVGLNECFRFCRYDAGGFFRRHCDAMYARGEDERSLFTCMFYLNGDLDGGATRFLNIAGVGATLGERSYVAAEEGEVMATLQPEVGSCLLFFQPGLLHEGADLRSGSKYILRTDVMFRRDPSTRPQLSETEVQALSLARRAVAAEESGELDLAIQLYRRAFKLDPRLERLH